MFKFVSLTALAALSAGAAHAQDASTATSWTGPYVGIHGGYGFASSDQVSVQGNNATTAGAIAAGNRPSRIGQDRAGWLGGGQVGYNLQRGNLLVGAEGDFSYMHSRGNQDAYGLGGQRTHLNSDMDWMGSARGRLGYVVADGSGMIYGTGGYAFGRVKGSADFISATGTTNFYGGHKYTAQGWTAGVGGEFRPFAHREGYLSHVSFRLESTYYDLGHSHIVAQQVAAIPGSYTLGLSTRGFNTSFGINYAF